MKGAGLALLFPKGKGGMHKMPKDPPLEPGPEEEGDGASEDEMSAASDFISAVKDGDPGALVSAFYALKSACEGME